MKNESHIKFCVAYTLRSDINLCKFKRLKNNEDKDFFNNFEDKEDALKFYEELLINPLLYTANFCEVIETTG